jgi:protocatechuate 3,4-dioxygenase beta subunit
VWSFESKRPLAGAMLDIWHVDVQGRYAMANGDFKNRVRLLTSEAGYYELESIHPVAYPMGDGENWRSPHVHFRISCPGYKTLITEFFFEGDPRHHKDPLFQQALMMPVAKKDRYGHTFEVVTFDIVLESKLNQVR